MEPDKILHNFNQLIGTHADGAINAELSKMLQETVAGLSNAVIDRGGKQKAKITLSVDIVLDQGVFGIEMAAACKMPKSQPVKSVYWATDSNKLCLDNPRQERLPFAPRQTAIEREETRSVG